MLRRPYISERGAHMRGPIPKPRTKSETPRMMISVETLKRAVIWPAAPLQKERVSEDNNQIDKESARASSTHE